MSTLGNIIWFLFGGFLSGLLWIITGLLFCLTIIFLPFGIQFIKIGFYVFCPFGKNLNNSMKFTSIIGNILWLLTFGVVFFTVNVSIGIFYCATIIGIPFGLQFFKIAIISLFPFGTRLS